MGEIKNKGRRFKSRTFPGLEALEGEKFYYLYYKGRSVEHRNGKVPKKVLERDDDWEEITLKISN